MQGQEGTTKTKRHLLIKTPDPNDSVNITITQNAVIKYSHPINQDYYYYLLQPFDNWKEPLSFPVPCISWNDTMDFYIVLKKEKFKMTQINETLTTMDSKKFDGYLFGENDCYYVIGIYGSQDAFDEINIGTLQSLQYFVCLLPSYYLKNNILINRISMPLQAHWAIHFIESEPSTDQLCLLSNFRGCLIWIFPLGKNLFRLRSDKESEKVMMTNKSELDQELGTSTIIMKFCTKCKENVESIFDETGKGSKYRCIKCSRCYCSDYRI